MLQTLVKLLFLTAVLAAGAVGVYLYYDQVSTSHKVRRLEAEKKQLEEIVSRLTGERRVAEMLVVDQQVVDGVKVSTLVFVEYGRDGQPLPPRTVVVHGETAHVDAMVIKFDDELVKQGDPLRGVSIALFTRIYGDATPPEQAMPIDPPGEIPAIYRGADPRVTEFEMQLWRDFWTLAYDESARKARGVRALVGQGIWEPVRPEVVYTLTLENDGGLSIRREPVRAVFREALRRGHLNTAVTGQPGGGGASPAGGAPR